MNEARGKYGVIMLFAFLLVLSVSVYAHGEEDFAKAEELIKQKIQCNKLNEEQLELMGEYYMEQMHPGELHEIMDARMGGEGSETLRRVHINMARSFYCGEHDYLSKGMMNVMMLRNRMYYSGENSSYESYGGMMNMMYGNYGAYGMMGSWTGGNWFGMSLLWLVYIALAAFVFGIIFWWAYKLIVKENKKK